VSKIINQQIDNSSRKSSDEYEDLKPRDKLSRNVGEINSSLLIYFKRNDIKFLAEIWTFNYKLDLLNKERNKSKYNLYYKKLSIAIRSIHTLVKVLPLYSLYNKEGFNYSIEYEVSTDNNEIENSTNSIIFDQETYSGRLDIKVKYLDKHQIFQKEESLVNNKLFY
jgi:hypothetical protein